MFRAFSGMPKLVGAYVFFELFGATWLILGAILGRAGSRRGSQNRVFRHHVGVEEHTIEQTTQKQTLETQRPLAMLTNKSVTR